MKKIDRILLYIIIFLSVLIILGTAISFATKKAGFGKNLRSQDPSPENITVINKKNGENDAAFNELGRLRIVTASPSQDEAGTTLVVHPWISYPDDSQFYEELYKKRSAIKSEITSYFSSRTKDQLIQNGEDEIKKQLSERINQNLSLGKITGLYFTEYIFFE